MVEIRARARGVTLALVITMSPLPSVLLVTDTDGTCGSMAAAKPSS